MSPPWTLFNMALLTLLTLLAATARGDARTCRRDQRPTIAATTPNKKHIDYRSSTASYYGEDVILFCSSNNASNLAIRNDEDQQLPANRLNSTTIQISLIKPDVDRYIYNCTDSNTSCSHAIRVNVRPAMSVRAPRVIASYKFTYLIPHGELAYDVFCSAHSVDYLSAIEVSSSGRKKLLSRIVINETTVMAKITNETEGGRYSCYWRNTLPAYAIDIIKGNVPEATKFRCILYPEDKVECSWESSNVGNDFKLYVLHGEGSTFLCRDRSVSITRRCEGMLDDDMERLIVTTERISLQVKTCLNQFCNFNQIFHKNPYSILKLPPISNLTLTNTSSQGATVAWSLPVVGSSYVFVYKVEYRLLGTDWRPANASAVQCERVFEEVCELNVTLPCPDTHYELRVYARTWEAIDDSYWSNPSTLFFYTARGMGGEVDSSCGEDFREVTQEPPPSATVLLYQVRQLISDHRKEGGALRKRVNDMKNKLEKIKALMPKEKDP